MVEEREIAWVTVPFAAGITAGIFTVKTAGTSGIAAYAAVLPAVMAALMLAFTDMRGGRWRLLCLAAYISIGYAAAWCHALGGGSVNLSLKAPSLACRWLKITISEIPFRDDRTGSLLTALLTGDKSGLSRETVASFRASGASHLLALSGLHLGVIYLVLSKVTGLLGKSRAAALIRCTVTIGAAAFYTVMVGSGASIVRAFLFICIREIAKVMDERTLSPGNTLLAALTLHLAVNPSAITGAGFEMSYLAMVGIIYLLPHLQSIYPQLIADFQNGKTARHKKGLMERIWDSMSLSVSCQIFTAPVAWIRFHSLPGHFLVTNLLALPLTTALITASLVTITLTVAGCCPFWMTAVCDFLTRLILGTLSVVSGM